MKETKKFLSLWGIGAVAVLTALTLTAATYAWFSSNREVETDKATSRTGNSNVELQVSRPGFPLQKDEDGAYYTPMKGSKEYYEQLGQKPEDLSVLMPVSTPDLQTFLYNSASSKGYAVEFQKVGSSAEDEARFFYHDTITITAVAVDGAAPEGSKMALYLDNKPNAEGDGGTPIVYAEEGELMTAARLGLRFSDGTFRILTLSDVDMGSSNTLVGGKTIGSDEVLDVDDMTGKVVPRKDPAIPLSDVQIPVEGGKANESLAELELNKEYTVDVYFYLEGCDPDCISDRVGRDDAVLNLAFFGLLTY